MDDLDAEFAATQGDFLTLFSLDPTVLQTTPRRVRARVSQPLSINRTGQGRGLIDRSDQHSGADSDGGEADDVFADLHDQLLFDEASFGNVRRDTTEWQKRNEASYVKQCQLRPTFFTEEIRRSSTLIQPRCCLCDADPIIRCLDCDQFGISSHYCGPCDSAQHQWAHFHQRQHSSDGHWSAIPPLQSYNEDGTAFTRGRMH